MPDLRWYQNEAIETGVFEFFAKHGGQFDPNGVPIQANPIIAMPTGTGKSLVVGEIPRRIMQWWPQQRFIMLTHVKELIEQNAAKLLELWPGAPLGIYSAGLRRKDTMQPIIYAGIDSAINNVAAFGWRDIIIIDECHLLSPSDGTRYQAFIAAIRKMNPWVRVIGLSATPYRQGLGLLTESGIFTHISYDITTPEAFARLIAEGYLARLIPKRTNTQVDLSGVKTSGGEYVQGALEAALQDNVLVPALQEMCEYGEHRRTWLAFAPGIERAEHTAEILRALNVNAVAVHSKSSDRDEKIRDYKAGRIRCLVGNNLFTTGFDHPPIDLIGMLRGTKSTSLWVQMLGRGTRPAPWVQKQDCLVLDYVGNTRELGPIDMPILPRAKKPGLPGDMPVCICPQCSTYNHARAVICIACGAAIEHELKVNNTASHHALMSSDAPEHEWCNVLYMWANRHQKMGAPDSVKLTFNCGARTFHSWLSIERVGYAGKQARDWWRNAANSEPPTTVDSALKRVGELVTPRRIKVWTNRPKYPEILEYEW